MVIILNKCSLTKKLIALCVSAFVELRARPRREIFAMQMQWERNRNQILSGIEWPLGTTISNDFRSSIGQTRRCLCCGGAAAAAIAAAAKCKNCVSLHRRRRWSEEGKMPEKNWYCLSWTWLCRMCALPCGRRNRTIWVFSENMTENGFNRQLLFFRIEQRSMITGDQFFCLGIVARPRRRSLLVGLLVGGQRPRQKVNSKGREKKDIEDRKLQFSSSRRSPGW